MTFLKVWHKLCFKCQECGMSLNMKNYKGFNKLPYCNAHCPQARATAVADTPEARRLAENTKLQSQVRYHEDFEKQKGKLTQVADDPETLRIRNISKRISNVAYHGELEKKKQMEQKRTLVPEEEINNGFNRPKGQQMPINSSLVTIDENKNSRQHIQHNDSINHNVRNNVAVNQYHPIRAESGYHTSNNINKDLNSYPKIQSTVIYTSDDGPGPPQSQMLTSGGPLRRPMTRTFRAIYDYSAQDMDEVSFLDGDLIINCQPIDEGWMTGTVERTGQTGMLPSNYVETFN